MRCSLTSMWRSVQLILTLNLLNAAQFSSNSSETPMALLKYCLVQLQRRAACPIFVSIHLPSENKYLDSLRSATK